jgi:hypothetical protein
MTEVKTIKSMVDLTNSEIKKAEELRAKIEKDLESYKKMLVMIQGMCKHVGEDGKPAVDVIGHSHNDTHYRCSICGEEYTA